VTQRTSEIVLGLPPRTYLEHVPALGIPSHRVGKLLQTRVSDWERLLVEKPNKDTADDGAARLRRLAGVELTNGKGK
jgi:hypothetical protein